MIYKSTLENWEFHFFLLKEKKKSIFYEPHIKQSSLFSIEHISFASSNFFRAASTASSCSSLLASPELAMASWVSWSWRPSLVDLVIVNLVLSTVNWMALAAAFVLK